MRFESCESAASAWTSCERNVTRAERRVRPAYIEREIRRLETDPKVTKHALRLALQATMPCGHASANLLMCDTPPYGCVVCRQDRFQRRVIRAAKAWATGPTIPSRVKDKLEWLRKKHQEVTTELDDAVKALMRSEGRRHVWDQKP